MGHSLNINDIDQGSEAFMKYSIKSLSESEFTEFKCLSSLKINPLESTQSQLLQAHKKPGRKSTDLGRRRTSYGKNELNKLQTISSIKDEHKSDFKSSYSNY